MPTPEALVPPVHKQHGPPKLATNTMQGDDKMMLIKRMLSIRFMVGLGLVAALILPVPITVALAAACLLPSLAAALPRLFGFGSAPPDARNVVRGRMAGVIEGDFCLFLIGSRLNDATLSNLNDYKVMGDAFVAMMHELEASPDEFGYLGSETFVGGNPNGSHTLLIQYWRSMDHVNRYARARTNEHHSGWKWLMEMGRRSPHLGFWHESYNIKAGDYDCIYVNMPPIGAGKAGKLIPAAGRFNSAAGRAGKSDGNDQPDELNYEK
eukprot:TRINITY_DN24267_c0_g1_i1.p1 TRINITY_DN24267_c0_g1~~TRINITY_DN24267_c0_g1_i1.p1  ORF type:complete len:266 (+),score=46.73 TRINITY_DN24267_c0_g1_i1:135-932(+)